MPEFVNPKYVDASRSSFKSPTRLECMMQDLPWLLPADANVSFTSFDADLFYSPVKNSLADARKKAASGLSAACAATGESSLFRFNAALMRAAGAQVESGGERSVSGIPVMMEPQLVLSPAFRSTVSSAMHKLGGAQIKITARSSLVLDGEDIKVEQLDLDGAARISCVLGASVTIRKLTVHNKGRVLRELSQEEMASPATPELLKLRGYTFDIVEERRIQFDEPGVYVIEE
uniref:Uncharacterized protein n=2 Tax=Chrysotila carterae TaxID=13221 RepID=A0A7S4B5V2_CHRCT